MINNNGKKLLYIGLAIIISLSVIVFTVLQTRKQQETRSKASGATVTLTLNPQITTKSVGETFSTDVFLNNLGYDISGVNIIINFDASTLEIIDFQPTGIFSKITNKPNNQIGTLHYYATNTSTDKIIDNIIKIGTLNFKAKTKGTTMVGFQKAEITASRQTTFVPTDNNTTASYTITQGAEAPTATPQPTAQPTNTPIPTDIPTPTEMPTPTLAPIPTPIPGGARVSLNLALSGLGEETGNVNPKVKQKKAAVCVYAIDADPTGDTQCNNAIKKAEGFIQFNEATKKFDAATFDLGVIDEKDYELFIKVDKYLRKKIPGAKHLKPDTTIPIQQVRLTAGDITRDNVLNIEDYNAYVNCFDKKFYTSSCLYKETVDLNDDLKPDNPTDFSDYKIFIQNFQNLEGD